MIAMCRFAGQYDIASGLIIVLVENNVHVPTFSSTPVQKYSQVRSGCRDKELIVMTRTIANTMVTIAREKRPMKANFFLHRI
jgi:hypothetical protein